MSSGMSHARCGRGRACVVMAWASRWLTSSSPWRRATATAGPGTTSSPNTRGLLCQAARAHLPEIDAVIAVRQLLSDLQPHLERGEVGVSLTRYAGETTLRAWLLGRLVAEIGRRSSGLCERPRVQRQRMPSARRLRLGVRFMHEEGLTAPEAAAMVGVNERSLRRAARNAAWRRAEQSRLEPAGAEW
jgi:hypothetical protein